LRPFGRHYALRDGNPTSYNKTGALYEVYSTARFFRPEAGTEQQRGQQVISGQEFMAYKGAVHGTSSSYACARFLVFDAVLPSVFFHAVKLNPPRCLRANKNRKRHSQ
jgi:hypothetical protein